MCVCLELGREKGVATQKMLKLDWGIFLSFFLFFLLHPVFSFFETMNEEPLDFFS